LQDELAHAVAATVGGRIDMAGRERSARLSPAGLKAYDLHLRAKASYLKFTKRGNEEARILAQEAMALDPMNAVIMAYYAHYLFLEYNFAWAEDPDQSLRSALDLAKQAVTLDDTDSTARWVLSVVYSMMRNYEEARVHIEKALELNPNDTEARCIYGDFLLCVGESKKALEQFEIVKRQNPFDMSWLPWVKGIAYFTARRHIEAIDTFNQIHEPNMEIYYWLAASYAHVGRIDEARVKLRDFLRIAERDMAQFPGQDPQKWMNYFERLIPYQDRCDLDHLCEGLRKAGLPI
jgi:adenylate cyclase